MHIDETEVAKIDIKSNYTMLNTDGELFLGKFIFNANPSRVHSLTLVALSKIVVRGKGSCQGYGGG